MDAYCYYLPETIEADLVLDYLKHLDLSNDLWLLCDGELLEYGRGPNQEGANLQPAYEYRLGRSK